MNRKVVISKPKVLIALSGGIDSAVSAYLLLKQGYRVEAAFMKNWSSTIGLKFQDCPWLQDRRDALRVAAFLKIPMHSLDFEKQYQKTVMDYFFEEYKQGRTPNPDVMCNKEIKFKLLYNWAMKNGFDYLATGHYAQVQAVSDKQKAVSKQKNSLQLNAYSLMLSKDKFKDQTYFIYNIKTEQLPHLLFPIGGMQKTEVKKLAEKIGLPNVGKKESMGLCFVGHIRLKEFLAQKLKQKPGEIVLVSSDVSFRKFRVHPRNYPESISKVLDPGHFYSPKNSGMTSKEAMIGQHQGLHNYTIGQRQGIKLGGNGPYFVVKKDLKHNRLYVTNNPNDERLMVKEVQIHSVNFIGTNFQFPISNFQLLGRYRHQGELVPLTIKKIKKDLYQVNFKIPQKAVASGQSLVLYNGKICVGGGVIV